jgi:hypothetical protein
MEHSIEADAKGSVAVREPRRGLPTGSPIADSDDEVVSPGESKVVEERPRHDPQFELPDENNWIRPYANGATGSGRLWLLALVVLAAVAAPLGWEYLQSYESTDDAQIDGHIDPLGSTARSSQFTRRTTTRSPRVS